MSPCRLLTYATFACLFLRVARTQAADLFPFHLPADELTEGITDLSFLNTRQAEDFVTVRDGHFFAGGQPIRFWGVCIIGLEAFPSHEDAVLFARRLASRGFNQARIHLIGFSVANRNCRGAR